MKYVYIHSGASLCLKREAVSGQRTLKVLGQAKQSRHQGQILFNPTYLRHIAKTSRIIETGRIKVARQWGEARRGVEGMEGDFYKCNELCPQDEEMDSATGIQHYTCA